MAVFLGSWDGRRTQAAICRWRKWIGERKGNVDEGGVRKTSASCKCRCKGVVVGKRYGALRWDWAALGGKKNKGNGDRQRLRATASSVGFASRYVTQHVGLVGF